MRYIIALVVLVVAMGAVHDAAAGVRDPHELVVEYTRYPAKKFVVGVYLDLFKCEAARDGLYNVYRPREGWITSCVEVRR